MELGHSERRTHFGETDAAINLKVKATLEAGLIPLVCVGETAEERRLDAAASTVGRQAPMALSGISATDRGRVLLADEPGWAIGEGGEPAFPDYANALHQALKAAIGDLPALPFPFSMAAASAPPVPQPSPPSPTSTASSSARAAWTPEGLPGLAQQVAPVVANR